MGTENRASEMPPRNEEFKHPQRERPFGQNSDPVEVFNALEVKKPPAKTPKMLNVERSWRKPIEEILVNLYWNQDKSLKLVGEEIGVSEYTTFTWFNKLGIERRLIGDAVKLAYSLGRKRSKERNDNRSPANVKLKIKERLGIDSDEDFKRHIEEKYRQYQSLIRTGASISEDIGGYLSVGVFRLWMLELGIPLIDRNVRINEGEMRTVEEAYINGRISMLTEKELGAVQLRFGLGLSLTKCARRLGLKDRRTVRDNIKRALKKLKTAGEENDVSSSQTQKKPYRLTMTELEREELIRNKNEPIKRIAARLGRSQKTVKRWREEDFGWEPTKRGRPPKEPETVKTIDY